MEWTSGTLENLCSLKKDTCEPAKSQANVYIGLEHIESGCFFIRSHGTPAQVISSKSCFNANDILYGKLRPYLDKAAVAETEGICSTDILVFTPKDKTPPFFIAGLLHSDPFIQYANQTTHGLNHPRTSWASLKDFPILMPPLLEQQKIASVLYKIQQAIEAQEKIIEKTRELKKTTMQHVFSHGLRGEKTKETEIGRMPESWEIVRIGECCDIKSSTVLFSELEKAKAQKQGVFCHAIKVSDMNLPGNEKWIHKANLELFYLHESLNGKAIPPNSIIFPKRGAAISTNKKRLTTQWTFLDPNLIAVIPVSNISYEYLYYWFLTFNLKEIQELGPTPQLNKKDVGPLLLPCPTIGEQKEIKYIFVIIDHKIELQTAKKSALQDLFKTMLNKLMTGEIRVKDLDLSKNQYSHK